MNVRRKIPILLLLGCALLAHSAIAATIVAASDASASSKAGAQFVCDGNNDQAELNSALLRGGEVILTEGTFRTVGTVYVKSGNILRGQGPDKTILAMSGNYDARIDIAQPDVTVKNLTITQRGWLMITTSRVKVHDVTIRDSKKEAPTVNGMFFVWASGRVCEDIEFVRCIAKDVGSTGFNLNGEKSPRVNKNIRFEDCKAIRCGNPGSGKIWAVGFDFHEGADLYDLYVNNCYAEDNWESGFYFEPNFYNGNDPNSAIPVQVNSRVSNCIAVKNGYRNDLSTRFYMTGYYLSCGVTLTNCKSINNRNNGFWLWQGSKDVILNGCTDDGSDKSFQVRTGSNLKFNNCISWNARTHALYAWGSSGVVFDNFRIINPKKTSGAVSLGLREDHPNDPWPVTGCTFDILLTGANPDTLIRYYNAKNNIITINGDPDTTLTPGTIVTDNSTPGVTEPGTNTPTPTPGNDEVPDAVGKGVIPGTVEFENYDDGGAGKAYYDTTTANEGGAYRRSEAVDIESISSGGYAVDYNRPAEWLQYTVNVTQSGTYDVAFRVATEKSATSFKLAVDGKDACTVAVPTTNSWTSYVDVKKQVTLTAGKRVLRVTTNGYHNLDRMTFTLVGTPPTTTVPTTPVPAGAAIPGKIDAENYNTGGEGVGYHDTTSTNEGGVYRTSEGVDIEMASSEGSHVVGWVRPGEWLKYTVNVAQAGVYDVSFRVSSPQSDSSFRMQVDGTDACTVMVPNTGSYLTYRTVVQQVSLPAGSHVLRLYFNGYTNVNWIQFQNTPVTTPVTPVTNTGPDTPTTTIAGPYVPPPLPMVYAHIIPGTVQAEDYASGGQGVGYYDTTSSNNGGIYRSGDDVDIELSQAGNPVICWIRPGEWLKYYTNVRWTGDYDVVFRVSSPQSNTQIKLQVDGITATTFTVPNTGSYQTYTNVTQKVRLTGGPHVLRLVFGGYHNIDYISFATVGTLTSSRSVDPLADANTTITTAAVPPSATVTAFANATATTAVPATTNATTATQTSATATATTVPVTATANATTATQTPALETTTAATVTATASVPPGVPVPEVPTITTTVPTTAPATPAATASVAPASPAPTDGVEIAPDVLAPVSTLTQTAPATITATAPATAAPSATPTEETVPEEMLVQVAATERNLSTFVDLVQKAGLSDTLNGAGPYTVLAPTDEAFAALPPGALESLLADSDRLASVLRHHVAEGRYTAANMTGMPAIDVLEGEPVTVTVRANGRLELEGATVNQTDIRAANGVIHVIDAVILPPDAVPTQTPVASASTTAAADETSTAMATTVAPPALFTDTTAAWTENGTPAAS